MSTMFMSPAGANSLATPRHMLRSESAALQGGLICLLPFAPLRTETQEEPGQIVVDRARILRADSNQAAWSDLSLVGVPPVPQYQRKIHK
ncbi:hypothetical protein RDI58_017991 [Solanum bulbocastanum]|uniref:Uncharacterized protein n=1 Tax=Solanum bulbocastanum TaxID=147425 RepID=A0AAN8TIQ4_SOLBU